MECPELPRPIETLQVKFRRMEAVLRRAFELKGSVVGVEGASFWSFLMLLRQSLM